MVVPTRERQGYKGPVQRNWVRRRTFVVVRDGSPIGGEACTTEILRSFEYFE